MTDVPKKFKRIFPTKMLTFLKKVDLSYSYTTYIITRSDEKLSFIRKFNGSLLIIMT